MNPSARFSLAGKVALVTGAASGLGFAIAEGMAEAGADVVCADRDGDGLKAIATRVRRLGRKVLTIPCDVAKPRAVKAMVAAAADRFGGLDILVNNAGVSQRAPKPVHEISLAEWNRVLAVDLQGVFYCAREALKIMVPRRSGKIINIASIWGLTGSSRIKPLPAYNAAKGAVVNLTREMGLEYAPLGINVNAICPGFFRTRLANGAFDNPAFVDAVAGLTAIGRVGEPEEIKGAAIFLASPASDYLCGQMLVVDGGVLAR